MSFILAQLNLNDWLSNASLFYKNMWIWDQRTIRSTKITIQWAINCGWTHYVTAKPQLFSHWRKVKHITEHCKLRKPKLTWQSHVWISLAGLLGGKVGLLLVQALHKLLGRGWCCPVDRECVSTLWVTRHSYGNSLAHTAQKSLHPKFSPVSWSSGRRRKRAIKSDTTRAKNKGRISLIDLWLYLWE